jgi:hypothetical protein
MFLIAMLWAQTTAPLPANAETFYAPLPGLSGGRGPEGPLAKLPRSFEENLGQLDPRVKFLSRGSGYALFLTSDEAVLTFNGIQGSDSGLRDRQSTGSLSKSPQPRVRNTPPVALRIKAAGANRNATIVGLNRLPCKSHYIAGPDRKKWRTGVSLFERVSYRDIYPGVEMVYRGSGRNVEYDFLVGAGADPRLIRLTFEGAERPRLDERGDLIIETGAGQLRQPRPVAYQRDRSATREVACRYTLGAGQEVGFELGAYDRIKPLVIDPVLSYAAYLGGSNFDSGSAIAVDGEGSAYVTGRTNSTDLAMTGGAFQAANNTDVAYRSTDAGATWNTASNGMSAFGPIAEIIVSPFDSSAVYALTGGLFVTGVIFKSTDAGASWGRVNVPQAFSEPSIIHSINLLESDPHKPSTLYASTAGRLLRSNDGGDSWGSIDSGIVKEEEAQTIRFTHSFAALAVDPLTASVLYTASSRGVFRSIDGGASWNPAGSFPEFPGSIRSFQIDPANTAIIYARTSGAVYKSTDKGETWTPLRNGLPTFGVNFLTISPSSSATLYAGSQSNDDAFVVKLNPSGSGFVYSTYLGGIDNETANRIAIDSAGNAYVAGSTGSTNFPVTPDSIQGGKSGIFNDDAFITKLNAAGTSVIFSTFAGGGNFDFGTGIAIDLFDRVYVTGTASQPGFLNSEGTPGGARTVDGPSDAFVIKLANRPRITGALVRGKDLLVTGEGFDEGAQVLLGGAERRAVNDKDRPGAVLVLKKAGKNISAGQRITLQVRNPDGTLSEQFVFVRPS